MRNARMNPNLTAILAFTAMCQILLVSLVCSFAIAGNKGEFDEKKKWLITVPGQEALKSVHRVAVFVTSAEPPYAKVLEDALRIELRKVGWIAVDRFSLGREVSRDWRQWLSFLDSLRADSVEVDTTKGTDELEIAKLVQADAFMIATLLVGRQQYVNLAKNFNASAEKIVATTISFQIISVAEERTILEAVLGYQNGKSMPYVAEDIRLMLEQYLK